MKLVIGRKSGIFGACLMLAVTQIFSQSSLAVTTLVNNNSTMTLDFNSSAGMTAWTVDSVNQVNQQSFWYRVGSSGPQFDLTQISAPTITPFGTRTVSALYSNATIGVNLSYTLSGQSAGSKKSGVNETFTLFNNSSVTQDFHFFMYADFVLGGASQTGSQNVLMGNSGGSSTSVQTFGQPGNNSVVSLTPATRTETALYPQTYTELTSLSGYSLDNTSASGPGNVTWAWEWDKAIAPGDSVILSLLDTMAVPEPSAISLALVGGGLLALHRRIKVTSKGVIS